MDNRNPIQEAVGNALALIITLTFLVLVMWLFWATISVILFYIGVFIGLCSGVVLCVWFATRVYTLYTTYQTTKADLEYRRAETEAKRVFSAGDQIFFHKEGYTEAWHLDPRWRHNGHYTEPTELELRTWLAFQYKNQKTLPVQPDITIEKPPLLQRTLDLDRILLVGGSGSGKTTYMQHFVANKEGDIVVCDPHDNGKTWPNNALVVGGGLDFVAIETELNSFYQEYRRRYAEYAKGESNFAPLYLVLDEWYAVNRNIDVDDKFKELLTGLRKVKMGLMVISQSFRASALGLKGNFDLKDSFEVMVHLTGTSKTGIQAKLIYPDNSEVVVEHPGPFYKSLPSGDRPYEVVAPEINAEKQQILALHQQGVKPWKIGELVFGNKGGWQTERVEEVIRGRT